MLVFIQVVEKGLSTARPERALNRQFYAAFVLQDVFFSLLTSCFGGSIDIGRSLLVKASLQTA